ncbi:MAG: YfhO family protein [Candidatus Omnitrophica bacterium]|nr:YfhO family protein [Candidatus Omnitrophota bacterium]
MEKAKRLILVYWPYFLIVTVLVVFYRNIFLAHGAWLVADHAEQHFPWAFELARNLKSGSLPFWTDKIQAGFPLVAEGQVGAFYLPNILFYGLFPIREGYAWNICFHLLLSAFFMLQYLKSLGLESRAIFFGTFVYLFGSTLGGAYYNITSLKVLTWFPLALWMIDRMISGSMKMWRISILLGVLFSLQLLAGYLQFAAYAILFSGFYLLARFFDEKKKDYRILVMSLAGFVLAVFIAAVLAYPQLILTFKLAIQSNRANPQEGFAYVGSYSPFALSCLFFPSLEGMFVSKLYLGMVPLYFMIIAFLCFRESEKKSFYWLVILSLLLALGQWSPLYVMLVKLFRFYSFRTPVKFIFFAGFFLCVLSAYGMQWVLKNEKDVRVRRGAMIFTLAAMAAFILSVIAWVTFYFFEGPLMVLGEWLMKKFIYGQPGHPFAWGHYETKLLVFMEQAKVILDPRNKIIYLPMIKIGAAIGIIYLFLLQKIRKTIFYVAVLVLLMADLNLSYSDIQGDYEAYQSFFERSKTVRFLESHLNGARIFNYSHNPSEAPLPGSKGMIYGLRTANAYSPLVLKDYYDFMSFMGGINDSIAYHPVDDDYLYDHLKHLGMLNVKYVVSDRNLALDKLEKVLQDGPWSIYENPAVMERYRLIPSYRIEPNEDALIRKVMDSQFDPFQEIWLKQKPVFYGRENRANVQRDRVHIISEDTMRRSMEVDSFRDQILLISETYDSGWNATVDGKEAEIMKTNGILSGIALKKGRHLIRLKYAPKFGRLNP